MPKIKTLIAIVLIVVGIAAFAYQGVTFMTSMTTPGGHPATMEPSGPHRMPVPPIIGVLALIAGIALLLMDDGDSRHRPGRSVTAARR